LPIKNAASVLRTSKKQSDPNGCPCGWVNDNKKGEKMLEKQQAKSKVYLTAEQEAERLGVPLSWIYTRVRKKGEERLPHFKAGKYLRFLPEITDAWLENRSD
jgi:hypothetical protein